MTTTTVTSTDQGLSNATARFALHERCLMLVRRWQPLARSGWDHLSARQLGDELDHIAETSERLGLHVVNASALELAAYLCSFIDDQLVPNENDLDRLAAMVTTLGGALSELAGTNTAAVHRLHPEAADELPTALAVSDPDPNRDVRRARVLMPRAVCLLGDTVRSLPGLADALRERNYQVSASDDIEHLLAFLDMATPGALLLDSRELRHLGRIRSRLHSERADSSPAPGLFVISPQGDLGDRLLAMRAGATALFSAPLDSLRMIARLDEALMHTTQTPWRVLLAEADEVSAIERSRWLAGNGMTVRIAGNGQAAVSALADFRPDVIVIDQELPDVHGLELVQLIRDHGEHAAVPIVLMSDSLDISHRFDAIAAGSDEVLLKPVKSRHLAHALLSRLTRTRWARDLVGSTGGRDPRTNLYSRALMIEKLTEACGDRSAMLMCIAIDRAQDLRERIGLSGLAALDAHVGQLLRTRLDASDIASHYRDFHYFVLMHRRSRSDATISAEEVRAAMCAVAWNFKRDAYSLTASIGLALLGSESAGVDAIVTNAEAAQIAAAHMGGNRVLWYEAREAALLPSDPLLAVRAVLGRPLKPEQATFDFLPIVALAGKLSGQFELRFRVRSAQNRDITVSYEELVSAAAETNQLAQVDRWLLQHTLDIRARQLKLGRQLRIFVPQSVESLMSADLGWWLDRELRERRLSGTGLTLILPCSPLIDAGERARVRLGELRKLGVRACLGDFGRDWAAVHALKLLPVDVVRLDPALVIELGATRSTADTVMALVRKAHAAGTSVIAPETDNASRAHLLLRLGVDYAIGPAFSPPLEQPDFDFSRPLW